jgi:hypothetical protein
LTPGRPRRRLNRQLHEAIMEAVPLKVFWQPG